MPTENRPKPILLPQAEPRELTVIEGPAKDPKVDEQSGTGVAVAVAAGIALVALGARKRARRGARIK